ncbi:MAG TPA: hypothetical protein DCO72_05820 [Ruminococcus sp.]|nr:hypothetical protein [Ruminococcus sp.]
MAKAKKKKQGHVAISFLVSFLLGILVIGGIAMYLFQNLGINQQEIVQMKTNVTKPTEEDNSTILFVLNEENDPIQYTFMIARLIPMDKKMALFAFPANMLAVVDGRQDTLAGFFTQSGIQAAKTAIENESGISIDHYVVLKSEGFQKICNIFGGVYYSVPIKTNGFEDSAEPQYLGAAQMEKLMTYPLFGDTEGQGEIQRNAVTSDMISEMINQTDTERITASMDYDFKRLINLMDTDISAMDYADRKNALKYMFTYGNTIASFRIVTGTVGQDGDVFLLSDNFYSSVSEYFRN